GTVPGRASSQATHRSRRARGPRSNERVRRFRAPRRPGTRRPRPPRQGHAGRPARRRDRPRRGAEPLVNAVVIKLYDYGRRAIADGLPDGPLRGVPFLVKDLTASIAGVPMTRGSRFFAGSPPPTADAEHV